MKTEVTFREGDPASDMTRDEVVAWLLGNLGTMTIGSGLIASWAISKAVDGLKDGAELLIDTGYGRYSLTVTASGHWWHRVRTYHAERT